MPVNSPALKMVPLSRSWQSEYKSKSLHFGEPNNLQSCCCDNPLSNGRGNGNVSNQSTLITAICYKDYVELDHHLSSVINEHSITAERFIVFHFTPRSMCKISMIAPTTIIFYLISAAVRCQQNPAVHLINRLNEFYRFDHQIFFMDSSIDLHRWLPILPRDTGNKLENFTPQTVYTFDLTIVRQLGSDYFNVTEKSFKPIRSKNKFLIVVVEGWTFENSSQLLTHIKVIRKLSTNVKIGVFFTRNFTLMDTIEQLFRWSWSAGIVNIFAAFHLSVEGDEPTFNIFTYNPFGTVDLINMSRSDSVCDYFPNKQPNYRQHPLRFMKVRELDTSIIENHFWATVLRVFNASTSKIPVGYAEFIADERIRGDILIHEKDTERHELEVYPYRQAMMKMIVPHAQLYSDFMAYLQNGTGTWTLLFVYAFIVIVASSLLLIVSGYLHKNKVLPPQCVADVVNLLMNDNAAIRYRNLNRADICVIVPLTFTGLIVMNGIVSLFQSYITSPIYQPQINTIKDLYESSVPILTSDIEWKDKFVELLEDISKYGGWKGKVRGVTLAQLKRAIYTFNNSAAYFALDYDVRVYLQVQKRLDVKLYHMLLRETLGRHMLTYQFSDEFPFIDTINGIIHRLNGAGLIKKWEAEVEGYLVKGILGINLKLERKVSGKTDVGEFSVPTAVWCGWILSVAVFTCEIIWYKATACTSKISNEKIT